MWPRSCNPFWVLRDLDDGRDDESDGAAEAAAGVPMMRRQSVAKLPSNPVIRELAGSAAAVGARDRAGRSATVATCPPLMETAITRYDRP